MMYLLVFTALHAYAGTPNIVHFMADDVGYNDLGFANGGLTHTPAIDALVYYTIFFSFFPFFMFNVPVNACLPLSNVPYIHQLNCPPPHLNMLMLRFRSKKGCF